EVSDAVEIGMIVDYHRLNILLSQIRDRKIGGEIQRKREQIDFEPEFFHRQCERDLENMGLVASQDLSLPQHPFRPAWPCARQRMEDFARQNAQAAIAVVGIRLDAIQRRESWPGRRRKASRLEQGPPDIDRRVGNIDDFETRAIARYPGSDRPLKGKIG